MRSLVAAVKSLAKSVSSNTEKDVLSLQQVRQRKGSEESSASDVPQRCQQDRIWIRHASRGSSYKVGTLGSQMQMEMSNVKCTKAVAGKSVFFRHRAYLQVVVPQASSLSHGEWAAMYF